MAVIVCAFPCKRSSGFRSNECEKKVAWGKQVKQICGTPLADAQIRSSTKRERFHYSLESLGPAIRVLPIGDLVW